MESAGTTTIVGVELQFPNGHFNLHMVYLAPGTLFVQLRGVIEEARISKGGIQACVGGFW